MKRTDNKLFGDRVRMALRDLLENDMSQPIFISLVTEAKRFAYQNLSEQSQEFRAADERAHQLYHELWKKEGSKNLSLFQEFKEYVDAADLANTMRGEEMYLRGLQDAISFFMPDPKQNALEATGFPSLDDNEECDIEKLPHNWKKIAQHIGIDSLIRLTEAMGGEYLFIPKKDNLLKRLRQDSIKEDRNNGLTYEEIAKKHDISVDTVRRALRK